MSRKADSESFGDALANQDFRRRTKTHFPRKLKEEDRLD